MTGNQYRDLIASYVHRTFPELTIYTEISLGKTIIGKDRRIDVFVIRESDQRGIALECKYQDTQGTTDEKIPYALDDLAALRMPGCLVYAGTGWSAGVLHTLQGSPLASYCLPDGETLARTPLTRELDHVLAMTFGLWSMVLPESRRFAP